MASKYRYEENLLWHLKSNVETWDALLRNGLTLEMEVKIDFSFSSPTKEKAQTLKEILLEESYEIEEVVRNGRKWSVEGKTFETTLTLQLLNDWVTWMVAAGKKCESDFKGWGIEVPRIPAPFKDENQLELFT